MDITTLLVVLKSEEGKNGAGGAGAGKKEPACMVENLRTTRFNDGTDIPDIIGSEWDTEGPAYCWYNNDRYNEGRYGTLYYYATFISGKLCSAGWHAPAGKDWKDLWYYLKGEWVPKKFKATGTTYRKDHGGTDEVGFDARGVVSDTVITIMQILAYKSYGAICGISDGPNITKLMLYAQNVNSRQIAEAAA